MLKILTNPNPILRQKAKEAPDAFDAKIQGLIPQMIDTMRQSDGAGLAAPQVGESIRLIVINHEDGAFALINPVIVQKSFIKEWGEEGCLSVPKTFGEVKRHKKVRVKFINHDGQEQLLAAHGLLARVIQHEIDHLDGILFVDKARRITSN